MHTLEIICHKAKAKQNLEEGVLNCHSILSLMPRLDKLVVIREDLSASNSMERMNKKATALTESISAKTWVTHYGWKTASFSICTQLLWVVAGGEGG